MNKNRLDEIDKYYKPIEIIDRWDQLIYWGSVISSILVLYINKLIPGKNFQNIIEVLFLILVILHLLLSLFVRYHLFPIAESKRRSQLLSNSFSIPLISENTEEYYNNNILPSVEKLGANLLENLHFSKAISQIMVNKERKKVLIYFLVWLIAVFFRSADFGIIVIITQTLFSSEILENWLRLEILCSENEKLFNNLYNEFLHRVNFESLSGTATTLYIFSTYEEVKVLAGIRLSSDIFFELNASLTKEWEKIKKQLRIDLQS